MEDKLKEAIQALTGREVVAFMSTNHLEPDLAAEVFVLDAPVSEHGDAEHGANFMQEAGETA
jgi:uncharacterized protein YbcI